MTPQEGKSTPVNSTAEEGIAKSFTKVVVAGSILGELCDREVIIATVNNFGGGVRLI